MIRYLLKLFRKRRQTYEQRWRPAITRNQPGNF